MSWINSTFGKWFIGQNINIDEYRRENDGDLPVNVSNLFNATPQFNDISSDINKLKVIFSNPAVLKVFKLQCDLFSLAKFYIYDKNDKQVLTKDPMLERLSSPNMFQTGNQLLWDFMFWNMTGTGYMYMNSSVPSNTAMKIYHLEPSKLEFPPELLKMQDKIILSSKAEADLLKTKVTYRYADRTSIEITLGDIMIFTDLTNGTGNWFKSGSVLDALYKVITNSDEALNSKNINTRYSGKFVVAGMADPENVTQMPMDNEEKLSIEQKVNGRKSVHAVKTMIDIKRFVENLGALKLDESYLADYFVIGSMFNIPRDVLEAYKSSTFENQEQAKGGHVAYTLSPKGEDLTNKLNKKIGYTDNRLVLSWDHLPFMQIFEQKRVAALKSKADAFVQLLNADVALDEINSYLDTNFKTGTKQVIQQNNGQTGAA